MSNEKGDVYQTITNQIIAIIEQGPVDYKCPWHRAGTAIMRPRNIASGNPYQGINILALWAAGDAKGYQSGTWGTYRQWSAAGAQVLKGERGSTVVFYKPPNPADLSEEETSEGKRSGRFVARASTVFAVEQTDSYTPVFLDDRPSQFEICEKAETFFNAVGAAVRHEGSRAFYSPAKDEITLPPAAPSPARPPRPMSRATTPFAPMRQATGRVPLRGSTARSASASAMMPMPSRN